MTYKSLLSACAAGFVFGGLGIHSATAQFLPPSLPSTYTEWQGPNGGSWDDSANWSNGLPASGTWNFEFYVGTEADNAFFGHEPVGGVVPPLTDDAIRQTVDAGSSNRNLRSLWFKAGLWYTLKGTGILWLGPDKPDAQDNYLLVVNPGDTGEQSEHTIEGFSRFSVSAWLEKQTVKIENYSEGGLGIFTERINLHDQFIQIGGTGATHFAGVMGGVNVFDNWSGTIDVGLFQGTGLQPAIEDQPQPHFVLSAINTYYRGELRVNHRGFAIIKADQALGGVPDERTVNPGGSLALRSHVETPLTYSVTGNNLAIFGEGIVRNEGTQHIGALYNDGGENHFGMRVMFAIETFFGARGDRKGGLFLTNQVIGDGAQDSAAFVKVGPGLIVLANATNSWTKDTVLRAGVLRLDNSGALPSFSNLVFDGGIFGGILELGYGTSFNYNLGTGFFNQLRWTGDGGFSAYGANREVRIVDAQNNLDSLTWGSADHFIGDGHALLLSSRYADSVIDFKNAINLNGAEREVRVERGDDAAHAILSGELSGTGGGLRKTGDGLLRLTGSNNYTGATRIEAGALRGAVGNASSNIVLAGGILGLDANFTLGLGGSGNQIRWDGSGGFAAYGQNRSVTFLDNDGDPVSLTWGTTGGFIGSDQELRFGHHTANRTVLWDNALALGSDERTIRIERGKPSDDGAVVNFRQAISGTGTLNLLGNGRIDLTVDNSALSGTINIYGAELRLHGSGKLGAVGGFDIRNGGALVLDYTSDANRLNDTANITLAAGTLRLDSAGTAISEEVGELTLESGANTIELGRTTQSTELHIEELKRDDDSRATLHVTGSLRNSSERSLKLNEDPSGYGINDEIGGVKIIPWATNGNGWLTPDDDNGSGDYYLKLATLSVLDQGSWTSPSLNVEYGGFTATLSAARTINSLIFSGGLNLNGHLLTLNSGGLMSLGDRTISGGTGSTITTASNRPLYIHNNGAVTVSGSVALTGGMDVVKTRGGSLIFGSSSNHSIGSLYIHQGTVELRGNGALQVRDRIYIGDGAGEDRLILPGGRWNPITKDGGGLPSITLRGTAYDPRGPEYGGDQAILQLGGDGGSDGKTYGAGTKQLLSELRIEGRGTIDWRGGEVGKANILWIETLSFSSTSDRLFIRNWYEYEDLFLVKKIHNGKEFDKYLLNQIVFEGYQDYFTTWKDYDKDYYQIYPFGIRPFPEPSTYGAILGAVGLGLWTWRKRRRQKS